MIFCVMLVYNPIMQINEKVGSIDMPLFYLAFPQYTKICFMCDIIKSRNTQIPSFFPHNLFGKPHIS